MEDRMLYQMKALEGDDKLSAAYIFYDSELPKAVESRLTYAQKVVMAQWYGNDYGVYAIYVEDEELEDKTEQLYGNVRLVNYDEWDLINQASAFLMNQKMYELLNVSGNLESLKNDASLIAELFEKEMFVVVTV